MSQIFIDVIYADIYQNIKQHLAVIGKRAKTVDGKSLFSDITLSDNEKPVFYDLIDSAAETIVANLADLSVSYTKKTNGIEFYFENTRWDYDENWVDADDKEHSVKESTEALRSAIYTYCYSYAVAEYLSMIHPATGSKYPPLYGQTYYQHCELILSNIRKMGFLKRPEDSALKSYKDISGTIIIDNNTDDTYADTVKPIHISHS